MKTRNNLTAILIVWSLLMLFLTSCSGVKLTTSQQQDLNKIDKQMNELWNAACLPSFSGLSGLYELVYTGGAFR